MPSLDWIGKKKVINHHLDVPYRILEAKEHFNTKTESANKIIKGDNLAALKSLLPEYEGKIKVCKMDVDANTETAPKFGIRGIPTLMIFKNGNAEATKVGALSKAQLAEFVESAL